MGRFLLQDLTTTVPLVSIVVVQARPCQDLLSVDRKTLVVDLRQTRPQQTTLREEEELEERHHVVPGRYSGYCSRQNIQIQEYFEYFCLNFIPPLGFASELIDNDYH